MAKVKTTYRVYVDFLMKILRAEFDTKKEARQYMKEYGYTKDSEAWIDKFYYVSQEKWDSIHDDYKGVWHSYYGERREWLGRKTVMSACITGNANENCGLLIEGVHFEIN